MAHMHNPTQRIVSAIDMSDGRHTTFMAVYSEDGEIDASYDWRNNGLRF